MFTRKRIVIALGGNALGNTLPEQMVAVKTTAKALCDLIEEGHQVVVVHGNGPQVGMINNAMSALSREDENQPNTPLSVCVAMSQAYIGYDLQNALREELRIRGFVRTPVVTVVTQVRVDPNDPAFESIQADRQIPDKRGSRPSGQGIWTYHERRRRAWLSSCSCISKAC